MEEIDLKKLIDENKKLGLIKSYESFCETFEADEYALDKEDAEYYKGLLKYGKNR